MISKGHALGKTIWGTVILVICIATTCVVPSSLFYHYDLAEELVADDEAVQMLNGVFTSLFFAIML